jgi:hypothetical protein
MFPGAGAQVYRNELGEVLGWGRPETAGDYYCDTCGFAHSGPCPDYGMYDEDEDEDDGDPPDYDPGDEVDDEGGMSEFLPDPGMEPPF